MTVIVINMFFAFFIITEIVIPLPLSFLIIAKMFTLVLYRYRINDSLCSWCWSWKLKACSIPFLFFSMWVVLYIFHTLHPYFPYKYKRVKEIYFFAQNAAAVKLMSQFMRRFKGTVSRTKFLTKGLSREIDWLLMTCIISFRLKWRTEPIFKLLEYLKNLKNSLVPDFGLELTIHAIKSQIYLVRQSLKGVFSWIIFPWALDDSLSTISNVPKNREDIPNLGAKGLWHSRSTVTTISDCLH